MTLKNVIVSESINADSDINQVISLVKMKHKLKAKKA